MKSGHHLAAALLAALCAPAVAYQAGSPTSGDNPASSSSSSASPAPSSSASAPAPKKGAAPNTGAAPKQGAAPNTGAAPRRPMRGLAQGGSSARPPAPAPSSTAASGQAASQPFGTGSVAPPPAAQALSQTAPGSDNGVFHPFSPPVHRNARNLSPASTANGPTAKPASAASSSDPVISKTFHKLVFNDSSLSSSAQNVRVYESGGKVTIEGKVASQAEKNNLGLKAAAFVGSANVVNNVTVDEAGASSGGSSDPMVTGAIHRVILGDRSLSNLAQNVGVSESGGKITLTGTVQSSDEKANVVAKAAAIMGPGNVVDNLNVQSDQPEPAPAPAPRRRPQAAPVPLEPPPDLPP